MFGAGSAEMAVHGELTPLEAAAARGSLPEWAQAKPARLQHMRRVAELMEEWARASGLNEVESRRWSAAGWLHDALRDADPAYLITQVAHAERDLPPKVLHGPAAAARLEGRVAPEVCDAIRFHTTGHPDLGDLGRSLYLADFLEPGRPFLPDWRSELRQRVPAERDVVLVEVLAARLSHIIDRRMPIRAETANFWSSAIAAGAQP